MDPLVSKMKEKRTQLNVSLMELAKQLDIPYDRMYKWEMRGTKPKHEDIVKLTQWVENDPITQVQNVGNTKQPALSNQIDNLFASVTVLQAKVSQLISDKTGRPLIVELENIQKEVRDILEVRRGGSSNQSLG